MKVIVFEEVCRRFLVVGILIGTINVTPIIVWVFNLKGNYVCNSLIVDWCKGIQLTYKV